MQTDFRSKSLRFELFSICTLIDFLSAFTRISENSASDFEIEVNESQTYPRFLVDIIMVPIWISLSYCVHNVGVHPNSLLRLRGKNRIGDENKDN